MKQIMQTEAQAVNLKPGDSFMGLVVVRVESLLPSGYRKVVLR